PKPSLAGATSNVSVACGIRCRCGESRIKPEDRSLRQDERSEVLAEREGFEPPEPFRVQWFSRPPPSTTRPSLRVQIQATISHVSRKSRPASSRSVTRSVTVGTATTRRDGLHLDA